MITIVVAFSLVAALLAFIRAYVDNRAQSKQLIELKMRVQHAERYLKARAHLANEVAHEIKNPITAILCSAEALELLVGGKIGEDNRKSLQYIREYGDILLRLVSDFLDLSRAEVGRMDSAAQPLEVVPCLESIVGLLQSRAMRKNISLDFRYEDNNLHCLADPRHVKQVLFNLIYNAIKFTPDSGEVEVIVLSDPIEPYVLIEVNDSGPGIPLEVQPQIFNLYYRYEHPEKDEQVELGTGLGLAVCKSLIELCGGQIGVHSQVGVGSSFWIRLPLCEPISRSRTNSKSDDSEQPLLGLSFLIVDEDLGSRDSVSKLIEAWGGIVDKVTMATEAIEALKIKSYDAVMIDDAVASANGYNLPRSIKEDAHGSTTVIVAGTSAQKQREALQAGADAYVEKPFNGTMLLESLISDPDSRH